jgi:oligogalacturonide lyase
MSAGSVFPSEAREFADPKTGARVRQITDHPSIHHHPFYYLPCYDDAMRHLVFVSHREGAPQIYMEIRETREIAQLTDCEKLSEWSVHPSHDGQYVYFVEGTSGCRVSTETFQVEELVSFGDVAMREKGMVGAAMGTTTLSRDDRWWAIPVKVGYRSRMTIVDTSSGESVVVLERDTIGHPQFHPDDAGWLRYAGPYNDRIWVMKRDGGENRLAYRRNTEAKEWVVHETWRPGSMEILTTVWPHGMIGIDVESGAVRKVCSFNAWHPMIDRTGTRMVADTNFPDRGLVLFDPLDGTGEPAPLCLSESSNEGAHWNTDHCPYDDGPVKVYAPQHTHPHPNFSPDGKFVVFTSDKSGFAQVYEVEVGE